MRPQKFEHELTEVGSLSSGMFGLSSHAEDQAHLLSILRDRLYTNKVLAVMREYSTNAWDAHVDAGKSDVPIRVRLPTALDPAFSVRDFGKGLSEEDVYQVFTQYGRSTKRGTNAVAGMLGIGCKSGFAYSASFTVTSYHGGKKMIFSAALDPTNMGRMTKLYEGPTEETGVEVKIPVFMKDAQQFHNEALHLYKFFDPLPDINTRIVPVEAEAATATGFMHRGGLWLAKMGCVTYRIDIKQVGAEHSLTRSAGGVVYAAIGELDVTASREELEYTERTKSRVSELIRTLRAEQLENLIERIRPNIGKGFLGRLEARRIRESSVDFALPANIAGYVRQEVPIWHTYDTGEHPNFFSQRPVKKGSRYKWSEDYTVSVQPGFELVVQDTRHLRGVDLGECRLISPRVGASLDEVMDQLNKILVEKDLVGLPIRRLSEMSADQPVRSRAPTKAKPTYSKKIVVWSDGCLVEGSESWGVPDRPMVEGDVYVHLDRFRCSLTLENIDKTLKILGKFGTSRPTVFGVRSGGVAADGAIHFSTWAELAKKKIREANPHLAERYRISLLRSRNGLCYSSEGVDVVESLLGKEHELSFYIRAQNFGHRLTNSEIGELSFLFAEAETPASVAYAQFLETYPLLPESEWGFKRWIDTGRFNHIARYIKMVDGE